ncbi:unnamed protein product, partial [Rotaria sp. Silwood1]
MKYPVGSGLQQNVWFFWHLPSIAILLSKNIAMIFAVEGVYYKNPMAIHKFWLTQSMNQDDYLKNICEICPE